MRGRREDGETVVGRLRGDDGRGVEKMRSPPLAVPLGIARGLGRAAHDGGGPADDRADQTALKRQAARGDHNDLG